MGFNSAFKGLNTASNISHLCHIVHFVLSYFFVPLHIILCVTTEVYMISCNLTSKHHSCDFGTFIQW